MNKQNKEKQIIKYQNDTTEKNQKTEVCFYIIFNFIFGKLHNTIFVCLFWLKS